MTKDGMKGWTSFRNLGLNTTLPHGRGSVAGGLYESPGGEDEVFGLETFVCTVAAALDLLAKLGSLKIVPETVEIPIIGLEISHRLEQLAEGDVAIGVDDAAHIARIAGNVLGMSLHFLHVIAIQHEPAHRGPPAADAAPTAVEIAPAELQLELGDFGILFGRGRRQCGIHPFAAQDVERMIIQVPIVDAHVQQPLDVLNIA